MFKKAHLVPSQHMGRQLYLWQHGDFGAPVLVFPSAAGMAHEWENQGMIEALAPLIGGRKIKLYCIESNVSEAWTKKDLDPAWRIGRHMAYERFINEELVPFIRQDCHTPEIPIGVTGTSLGAFFAANFALKNPEVFRYALCMSGRYDIRDFNPLQSVDVYFNNPLAYLGGMEGELLEKVRKNTHLDLICGRGPWEDGNWQETQRFSEMCTRKGISNRMDLWGKDVDHEWGWWRRQAKMYLGHRFG